MSNVGPTDVLREGRCL